jgi:hypothetical protein
MVGTGCSVTGTGTITKVPPPGGTNIWSLPRNASAAGL